MTNETKASEGISPVTPYMEKVFNLLIKKSSYDKGHSCVVDMDNDLDELGYKRNKKNRHYSGNKRNYVEAIEKLSMVMGRGKFEGSSLITLTKVNSLMEITIPPILYEDVAQEDYVWIPDDITKIDIRKYPYAIRMHLAINYQWSLSYKKNHGRIKCSLREILIKSYLFSNMPKRKDRRSKFIEYRLREFKHLVKRGYYKSFRRVKGEKHHDPLDDVYEIILPDNHGLHLQDDSNKEITMSEMEDLIAEIRDNPSYLVRNKH